MGQKLRDYNFNKILGLRNLKNPVSKKILKILGFSHLYSLLLQSYYIEFHILQVPYGYEYNGQAPLLDASLACDRIAYGILTAVSSSGGICVLNQDARKNQLKSMCFIFGRPIFFVSSGIQDNFGEALVGSVITNTWIYVRLVTNCFAYSNRLFLFIVSSKCDVDS